MNIVWSKHFEDDVKYYLKKKKYNKIFFDIEPIINELSEGNLVGVKLDNIEIPENTAVYKVRVANSSINVGKSNGFRIIYYLAVFIWSRFTQRKMAVGVAMFRMTSRSSCWSKISFLHDFRAATLKRLSMLVINWLLLFSAQTSDSLQHKR